MQDGSIRDTRKQGASVASVQTTPERPKGLAALQALAGNQAICRWFDEGSPSFATVRSGGLVRPEVSEAIAEVRGRGRPLGNDLAVHAGHMLGAELSDVRVHTDDAADLLSQSIGARAFTTGKDIFFRRGSYSTGTSAGRQLLGHELVHAAHQGPVNQPAPAEVAPADGKAERAADRVGDAVAGALDGHRAGESTADGLGASMSAIGGTADAAPIHRAVGFEFQTGWGLVRSLPTAPNPLNAGKAEDRDPSQQGDYPDEAVTHGLAQPGTAVPSPTRALPPQRSVWDKLKGRNKPPKLGASPTTPKLGRDFPMFDFQGADSQAHTDTMYQHKGSLIAHPTAGRQHFKYFKGQIIKDYGDFKMTVDDATTPLGAELEWVVDPPVADSASPKQMGKVMDHLLSAASKLLKFKMRESFLLSEVTKDAADDTVELQPAVKGPQMRNMDAASQATGGVSMDKLVTLFADLARRQQSNSLSDDASTELKGQSFATSITTVATDVEGSAQLKGLVGYISRYLDMGKGNTPLSYAKVNTQFLARTDFATMFSHLPDEERRKYGGNHYQGIGGDASHVDDFAKLVTDATGVDETRKIFVGGFKSGGAVKKPDLTVGDWLRGIPEGIDLLSGKYWKEVSNDLGKSTQERGDAKSFSSELESMGNLRKTDPVGAGGADPGIIMEFRSNTDPRPVNTWKKYAVTVFSYLKELNR